MNRAIWLIKKNQICILIKKISDYYGKDDIEWLREYTRDIIEQNKKDIQKLLDALWNLEKYVK